MTISEKLAKLRRLMHENQINTYIITKFDPHQSEYVAEYWSSVAFISGFTGSAGTVVVTMDKAGLWTDGRYTIQAKNQLQDSEIVLFPTSDSSTPKYADWAADHTPPSGCIGFDGRTLAFSTVQEMKKNLSAKKILIRADKDLIGDIWCDRPSLPSCPIFDHSIRYCGVPRTEKIKLVQEKMKERSVKHTVISSLDDIAWLFNLRGRDIPYNMVFYAYAIVSLDSAKLFVHAEKIPDELAAVLAKDGVQLFSYDEIQQHVYALTDNIYLNTERAAYGLVAGIPADTYMVAEDKDITTALKAIKNEQEIASLRETQVYDGVAMFRFITWLKQEVTKREVREFELEAAVAGFRAQQPNYIQPSFDTIAAYMANAAMMHYSAKKDADAVVKPEGFLLLDSGGQYFGGTTDITRTIAVGELTEEMKRDFTIVLKSHIALATAKFLYGATGTSLDAYARKPMWELGMDYKSGTGHGVGFCLGVHEGPQRIGMGASSVKIEPGMVTTNEPGIYKQDRHGIRTENTLLAVQTEKNECGQFMAFETISYCPIDLDAVDASLLSQEELAWLNTYHQTVYEKLSPHLDQPACTLLAQQTKRVG